MTITDDALDQIPGYTEAARISATLNRWAPEDLELSAFDPIDELMTAAASGAGRAPAGFVERVGLHRLANEAANDAFHHLRNAKSQASERKAEIVRSNPDPALKFLAGQLAKLVTTVNTASRKLGSHTTVEAALRAGGAAYTAWETLTQAVTDYNQIRRAQQHIVLQITPPDWATERSLRGHWFRRTGLLADHLDSERWWIEHRIQAAGATLQREVTGEPYWWFGAKSDKTRPVGPSTTTVKAWPAAANSLTYPGHADAATAMQAAQAARIDWLLPDQLPRWGEAKSDWWPTDDHLGYLRWICANAQPWVPTHKQMVEADVTALAATNPLSNWPALISAADALNRHNEIVANA